MARSSIYKIALWTALGPFSFFMGGPVAIRYLHREQTLSEAVIGTLIVWPIMCWCVQREWHELRTSLRQLVLWRIKPRWTWWGVVAFLAVLALILAYANKNPVNAIGLAISMGIVGVLSVRMAQACLREQEAMREQRQATSQVFPLRRI